MKGLKLKREDCVLVVIDYQTKLVPAMFEKEKLVDKSARLIKGFEIMNLPVIATQQYSKGLGETIDEIRAANENMVYVEKNTFSAWDNEEFVQKVKELNRQVAVVIGVEAHVCEQQTVLDMIDAGYTVYVAADCVSSRDSFDRDVSIERMRDAGAVITTYESILFELLGWSKAPEFKQISALVK